MRLDAWLLDRVAQPLADRLAGWVSPYSLAGSLAAASTISAVAALWRLGEPWPVLAAWAVLPIADGYALDSTARRAERETRTGRLNRARVREYPTRCWWLGWVSGLMAFAHLAGPLVLLYAWSALLSIYLSSVERPVPPPRRVSVGEALGQGA